MWWITSQMSKFYKDCAVKTGFVLVSPHWHIKQTRTLYHQTLIFMSPLCLIIQLIDINFINAAGLLTEPSWSCFRLPLLVLTPEAQQQHQGNDLGLNCVCWVTSSHTNISGIMSKKQKAKYFYLHNHHTAMQPSEKVSPICGGPKCLTQEAQNQI